MVGARPLPHPPEFDPHSRFLSVVFGQKTFDAEGVEAPGRHFSRVLHWPGGASGLTIGRGYDMGQRTSAQVVQELTAAGVGAADSQWLAACAGLRGAAASNYLGLYGEESPLLSLESQNRLFELVTAPQILSDIHRILSSPATIAAYGAVDWNDLSRPAQELLFDMRYRGDFTPQTRALLMRPLVENDTDALKALMGDTALWQKLGVPVKRIETRIEIAKQL